MVVRIRRKDLLRQVQALPQLQLGTVARVDPSVEAQLVVEPDMTRLAPIGYRPLLVHASSRARREVSLGFPVERRRRSVVIDGEAVVAVVQRFDHGGGGRSGGGGTGLKRGGNGSGRGEAEKDCEGGEKRKERIGKHFPMALE